MKRSEPSAQFWTVLAAVNVVALIYPVKLWHRAETTGENLFVAFALLGFVFVLMVVDALSIVIADVIGNTKRSGDQPKTFR